MINWIISISTITILSSLLITLLPENEKTGIVKFVFSLIVILVVIKPGFNSNDLSQIFANNDTNEVELQEDFLDYYSNKKIEYIKNECNIICIEEGVKDAIVSVGISDDNLTENNFTEIKINLLTATFNDNLDKKIVVNKIEKKIKEKFNIRLEMVY